MQTNEKIDLAIVIPAYKAGYLHKTLESIASQTNKHFRVYIGDDNSPEDIFGVVSKFNNCINCIYKRFDNNLGGKDLVAQWERCIAMTVDEKWIWLFSDDDYMDSTCVENFYKQLELDRSFDLYRFDLNIIDQNETITKSCILPSVFSTKYLFRNKLKGSINIFAVEFIFSRRIYEKERFQNFDLAWGSDTATWMKFGEKGICTIAGPRVYWRNSGENITGKVDAPNMVLRKLCASNNFLIWAKKFWKKRKCNQSLFIDYIFVKRIHGASLSVPLKDCISASSDYLGTKLFHKYFVVFMIYLYHGLSKIKL